MIKIISKKKYNKMLDEIQELKELRGAHQNLHFMYKGLFNKSQYENNSLKEKVKELEAKLNKAEHDRNVALKKLSKMEKKS